MDKKLEKPSTSDVPQIIAEKMDALGFGSGTKELLRPLYVEPETPESIVGRTSKFYGVDKSEVIWIQNPDDPDSIFVFVKKKQK